MNEGLWVLLGMSPIVLAIHLAFVNYIAKQAADKGYSYWEWIVICFFTSSLVFAVFLALLPDRSLERRRLEKRKLLQGRLRRGQVNLLRPEYRGTSIHTSLGDMATMDPEKLGLGQSIGDQATQMPFAEQSMGDAQTQLPRLDQSLGDQATYLPDSTE